MSQTAILPLHRTLNAEAVAGGTRLMMRNNQRALHGAVDLQQPLQLLVEWSTTGRTISLRVAVIITAGQGRSLTSTTLTT